MIIILNQKHKNNDNNNNNMVRDNVPLELFINFFYSFFNSSKSRFHFYRIHSQDGF